MSVLRAREGGGRHHDGREPFVIQGDVIVLLLIVLACGWVWHSAFRSKPEPRVPIQRMQRQLDECPFTIRQVNKTTYVVRELDRFGENPHIYVKKHTESLPNGRTSTILVVNDTGCGTTARSKTSRTGQWNIKTFIDHHLNPSGSAPYLVILSHCHYDHILGLGPILQPGKIAGLPQSAHTLIASSSYARSFLEPRTNLREHSLCNSMNLVCPSYKTTTWAQHNHRLSISHPRLEVIPMHLPVTTLHTPGHTPDSLSWFDEEERALYVGDSLYEAPAPILFPSEGNLADWWRSVDLLIAFVTEKNEMQGEQRVTLSAGHVTVGVDALGCLTEAKEFMKRVLRDEVAFEEQPLKRGEPFGQWQENGRFSLCAPLRVIQEGRLSIPEEEWRSNV